MPQRIVNTVNKGPETTNEVGGSDANKIEFDGQTYQLSTNPATKTILPDGAGVREFAKVDDSTSGLNNPDTAPVRS